MRLRLHVLACASLLATSTTASVAAQGRTHAVIVVGLGGAAEYRESFHDEASRLYAALIERHGLADDDVTYLEILNAMIGFTALFNDTGLPAISLPLGWSKIGLPVRWPR